MSRVRQTSQEWHDQGADQEVVVESAAATRDVMEDLIHEMTLMPTQCEGRLGVSLFPSVLSTIVVMR